MRCELHLNQAVISKKNDKTDVCIHVIYKAYEAHKHEG